MNSLSTSGGITKSALPPANVGAVKSKIPAARKGTMKKGK